MSLGLARTIRNETEIEFGILELESFDESGCGCRGQCLGEFLSRPLSDDATTSEFKPNLEWSYCDGMVHVGRFHWTSVNDELARLGASGSARRLEISKHGLLSSLYWKQFEPEALTGNMVQIQTRNIGLNFKDVLISMGIVDGQGIDGDDGLGCEGAGVIEKVGPEVKGACHWRPRYVLRLWYMLPQASPLSGRCVSRSPTTSALRMPPP